MGKTGRRSRGGLTAQVKENVPGGLGRRADVTGELRWRAPTSSSSPTADAAARENHHLRGLLEAAGAQQQPAARWRGAGACSSRVESRIGTACAVAERWSGRHVRCWQLVPPACPCAHCICMDAPPGVRACQCGWVERLQGVARDGCGVRRPLGRLPHACTCDRWRVPCLYRIAYHFCHMSALVLWDVVWRPPRRMRLWGSICSCVLEIYLVYIQA